MLIVLMGASAAGKDRLQNLITSRLNIPVCVSHTTRAMREGEVDGKSYHFVSKEKFLNDFENEKFLEYRSYQTEEGTWYYGLAKDSVDLSKNQITIVDEKGYLDIINKLGQENILGFYVHAPERIKILRALKREPNRNDDKFFKELYRRFLDDMKAFELVKHDPNVIKIENIDLEEAFTNIVEHLKMEEIING